MSAKVRNLVVTTTCSSCQAPQLLEVNKEDYEGFINGKTFVQVAFPYLTPAERELFISGTCDACWKAMVSAWGKQFE